MKSEDFEHELKFHNKDINIMTERFKLLASEVDGTQRKFLFNIRHIEERLEKIDLIKT
jgi:hypothetical protein